MDSIVSNAFLFSFEGRITRLRYCYALLASLISCLVCMVFLALAVAALFGANVKSVNIGIFDVFSIPPSPPFSARFNNASAAVSLSFYAMAAPVFVVSIWFLAATSIKRLHDRDRSGWWMVAFLIAPALFGKIGDELGESYAAGISAVAAVVLNAWGVVELVFLRGTIGPNRFGPDPLAPVDTRPPWSQIDELEFVPYSAGPPAEPHVMRGHD
jgi:uncharacterized membrane protein YhaH (DUF805 family)